MIKYLQKFEHTSENNICNSQKIHEKISLAVKSMSNKTTMRYHHAPIRMTEMKKTDNISVGENAQQLEFSYIVGGDVKR